VLVMCPLDDAYTIVLGIELKAGKGKQSESQKATAEAFAACEAGYMVCRSLDEVVKALDSNRIPLHARPA
jgi:hypothetical protein